MRNRLIQLLSDNRRPFVPMAQRVHAAVDGEEATIYLYDPIVGDRATAEWWGGVCPQDFVPALHSLKAKKIHLRVNSPGGDVFGAEAMCQALREHDAHIVAHIEGLAASAATSITCACDEVRMTPASKFMVHETWTLTMGNKRDHAATMDLLSKCDESMYAEYAARTGQSLEQLRAWCEAETWFTAQQAIDAGFVDALAETAASRGTESKAAANARWRLSAYLHAPAQGEPADADNPLPAVPAPVQTSEQPNTGHRQRQQQRLRLLQAIQIE
jgi:ATP-dependent Clp protease protease subunit